MKTALYIFVFLSVSVACFATTDEAAIIREAKEQLKHANTYYWLSRSRDNDLVDVNKMLFHAKTAKDLLKGLVETSEVRQMKYQAYHAIAEAKSQIVEASKKIASFSPLLSSLVRKESVIDRYRKPDDVAIERCLEGILKLIRVPRNVSQLYLMVLAQGNSITPLEIAHERINADSRHYSIPRYELSTILTETEVNSLKKAPISKEILVKICQKYSTENIGVLRLNKNDEVGRVSYWRANYNFWNADTAEKSYHCHADGFCESPFTYSSLLWLLVLAGFPSTLLFNQYNKKFNRARTGSFAPLWLSTIVCIFSLLVIAVAFKGVSALNIDLRLPIGSPMGIGWIAGFTIILGLLPILLAYIGASRIRQISAILNNPETVSSIVFGSYLGAFTFLAHTAAVRLGPAQSLLMVAPATIVCNLVALRLGLAFSRYAISNDKTSEIEYIVLVFGLLGFMFFVLVWDLTLLLFASAGLLVFSVLGAIVSNGIVKIRAKLAKQTERIENETQEKGLTWLRREIKAPEFFCKSWEKEFQYIQEWIIHKDDPQTKVVFIEAPIGCGKTRTANEIGRRIADQYRDSRLRVTVLFGDCDEFDQTTDIIPYEPFVKALGDLLGVGKFSDPGEKANKLTSGLVGMGLRTVMNAAGMGCLQTLLDARGEEHVVKTNTREIAKAVAEALVGLSKVKDSEEGKVIFIIDDVQWMDKETRELLKLLFKTLMECKDSQVSFIFTCRSDSPLGHRKVRDLLENLHKNKIINLNFDINQKLLENDEIVDALLDQLKFDYRPKHAMTEYFREMGIVRPLFILQTIETMIEKQMIESVAGRFLLSRKADLKQLPQPNDFRRMVEEELTGLDPKIVSILQCCAVIGRSFKISIVAAIFKMDLLELLDLLKDAEKRGIIRDVCEEDERYEFLEKRLVGIFRGLKVSPMEEMHIAQNVREYHKRFILEKEREIQELNTDKTSVPYRDILSLASHSFAVKDFYPDKAIFYNRLAAEKTYARGMFSSANLFYGRCSDIIDLDQKKIHPMEKLGFFISYAKCLLDEQAPYGEVENCIKRAGQVIESSEEQFDNEPLLIELGLVRALNNYRGRHYEEACSESQEIMSNDKASLAQKARAKFYHAASLPLKEKDSRKNRHLEVLQELDDILEGMGLSSVVRIELLKVKSEAANSTGFIFLFGERSPALAMSYFEMALRIKLMPEINDRKGLAIAHGGLGDCYKQMGQLNDAKREYELNLNISEQAGDKQGICRMASMLGEVKIEEAKKLENEGYKELIAEARRLYEKSLAAAENQMSPDNICFALAGIIETIVASKSFNEAGYVLSKLEGIQKELDLSNASDDAKNAIKGSLSSLVQSSPEHADSVEKQRDAF